MRIWLPLCSLLLSSGGATLAQDVPASADRGLRGVLAVRGEEVLASVQSERLFTPASVQKLLVTVAALHHLGPDYRTVTHLRGVVVDHQIPGDLVIDGAGDPTWNDTFHEESSLAPLDGLATQLQELGVERVKGDLVVDASRFPGRVFPVDWSWADTALSYGAPPSALGIDRNVTWLRLAPARRVGEPARVQGDPLVQWVNQTTTVPSSREGRGTIEFQMAWGEPKVVVRGEYPISEPALRIEIAVPDPNRRVAVALRDRLAASGVEVMGEVRLERSSRQDIRSLPSLAAWQSRPLSEWLEPILTDSDNWTAEMLLRTLALEVHGEGRLDLGVDALGTFLEETVGMDEASFAIDDGSGLSPVNLLSPAAAVRLLQWMWKQEWRELYLGALADGGNGTLSQSWPKSPPLAAKTGTLKHTQTLAGVLDPQSETPTFFAYFLNHRTEPRAQLKREIVRDLWDWYRATAR